MAIFDVEREANKDHIQLLCKLIYITDWCSTRQELIYGSAVSTIDAYEEMMAVKIVFDQTDRSAYRHYVLSLPEEERISLQKFKLLSMEVCELISKFYGNFQVLMAVHIDTDNLHAHYVANTIDYVTGERLNLDWKKLEELKCRVNIVLSKYGLSPIRMRELNTANK